VIGGARTEKVYVVAGLFEALCEISYVVACAGRATERHPWCRDELKEVH